MAIGLRFRVNYVAPAVGTQHTPEWTLTRQEHQPGLGLVFDL